MGGMQRDGFEATRAEFELDIVGANSQTHTKGCAHALTNVRRESYAQTLEAESLGAC